jgi:hypothetical protein
MKNFTIYGGSYHDRQTKEERLSQLSKVDFNASVPKGKEGADDMHEYLSLLTEDIRKLSRACMVNNVSFGGADGGGGVVTAAVQGEHVEAVQAAHPGIKVRPLTALEYVQVTEHDSKFGPEADHSGNPINPPPRRRAA